MTGVKQIKRATSPVGTKRGEATVEFTEEVILPGFGRIKLLISQEQTKWCLYSYTKVNSGGFSMK